jgi:phosphoribosylaminoimidazole-succinocarboxamide synthase
MNSRRLIYEGNTKILYDGYDHGTHILHFKDSISSKNISSSSHGSIGKGSINNRISSFIMSALSEMGITTHFLKPLNMREQLIYALEMLPLKVKVRNVAAGSMVSRLGLTEGIRLPKAIVEFYAKMGEAECPLITTEHLTSLGWASPQEVEDMVSTSLRINDFLCGMFAGIGIKLVDFNVEYGRYYNPFTDDLQIMLGDEISPDCCRLWDLTTNEKYGKDKDIAASNPDEAYHDIAQRLRLLGEFPFPTLDNKERASVYPFSTRKERIQKDRI